MNILNKIVEVSKLLDELDDYAIGLSEGLSNVDSKLCDLYHLIENDKLRTKQCYRVVQEIHKLRKERRKIKNDMELINVFNTNKNKLLNIDYRKILLSAIGKEDKKLNNSKYKNRVYTEEEIKELMGE